MELEEIIERIKNKTLPPEYIKDIIMYTLQNLFKGYDLSSPDTLAELWDSNERFRFCIRNLVYGEFLEP